MTAANPSPRPCQDGSDLETAGLSLVGSQKPAPPVCVHPVGLEGGLQGGLEGGLHGDAQEDCGVAATDMQPVEEGVGGEDSSMQPQEALWDMDGLGSLSLEEEVEGPASSASLHSPDLFGNEENIGSLPSSSGSCPIPASQFVFMAKSQREVPSNADTDSSLGEISDIESVGGDMEDSHGGPSPARQYFVHSDFENQETLASLAEIQEHEKNAFGLVGAQCLDFNVPLDAFQKTPSKLVSRNWIVDIEAETLQQFPYYKNDFEENSPHGQQQDEDDGHSEEQPITENGLLSEESCNMPSVDEAQISYGSSSTSTSPNRDLDALQLTQSAPLKRRASFKRSEQLNVKRSRRNWEQWYEQFKTIVTTGEQKKVAQAQLLSKFSNETDAEDNAQVDTDLEMLSPVLFQHEISCKSGLEGVSIPHCSTPLSCNRGERPFTNASQSPFALTDKDQLVPEENCPPNAEPCCSTMAYPCQRRLFNWEEPSWKPSASEANSSDLENEPSEEPQHQYIAQRSVLRLGLSKRHRPKPLHPQKPK
ncbi:uncharacterized protein LOC117648291 isoform X2 [Thrips palmi]|nr:uncharacterized protein LOC117648291 isoform X2 [Thrips palmi]